MFALKVCGSWVIFFLIGEFYEFFLTSTLFLCCEKMRKKSVCISCSTSIILHYVVMPDLLEKLKSRGRMFFFHLFSNSQTGSKSYSNLGKIRLKNNEQNICKIKVYLSEITTEQSGMGDVKSKSLLLCPLIWVAGKCCSMPNIRACTHTSSLEVLSSQYSYNSCQDKEIASWCWESPRKLPEESDSFSLYPSPMTSIMHTCFIWWLYLTLKYSEGKKN